jgi:hypothetical protein
MEAADALSDQPEPARTVAEAAYGSCGNYEVAYGQAHGLDLEGVDRIKAEALTPKVLARVMADRAVRAKLQKETPSRTSPAIDYNRM